MTIIGAQRQIFFYFSPMVIGPVYMEVTSHGWPANIMFLSDILCTVLFFFVGH